MDEEGRQQSELIYKQSKEVFMDACKKIFPELKAPNEKNIGSLLYLANDILISKNIIVPQEKDSQTILNQYLKDPKHFLDHLSSHQNGVAMQLRDRGFDKVFSGEQVNQSDLATGVAMLYQMELAKDKIQQEVYGNANTVEDMKKMDRHKEVIKGGSIGVKKNPDGTFDYSRSAHEINTNLDTNQNPELKPESETGKIYKKAEEMGIPKWKVDLNISINNIEARNSISVSPQEKQQINNLNEGDAIKLDKDIIKLRTDMINDNSRVGSEKVKFYSPKVREIFKKYNIS